MTDQTPRPGTGPTKKQMTIYRAELGRPDAEAREDQAREARRADRGARRAAAGESTTVAGAKGAAGAKSDAPPRAARKRSANAGRIAAAGIGIAAMAGLVANMEISAGNAQTGKAGASTVSLVTQPAARNPHQGAVLVKLAEARAHKPIVLTPHAVVNTVSAQSSGGGSYSAAGSYSAPAAAAPVASSGGSRP
jgi:hypothetical protein